MNTILLELRRGNRLLAVRTTTWRGEERVDVRWWWWTGSQWVATRAGVSVTRKELQAVIEALAVAWERMGGDEGEGEGEADADGLLKRLLAGLTGDDEPL